MLITCLPHSTRERGGGDNYSRNPVENNNSLGLISEKMLFMSLFPYPSLSVCLCLSPLSLCVPLPVYLSLSLPAWGSSCSGRVYRVASINCQSGSRSSNRRYQHFIIFTINMQLQHEARRILAASLRVCSPQSGPQSVAQLLATFSASCCVKFDTLAMLLLLLFLLQLLLLLELLVMTTHCSQARHTGNI